MKPVKIIVHSSCFLCKSTCSFDDSCKMSVVELQLTNSNLAKLRRKFFFWSKVIVIVFTGADVFQDDENDDFLSISRAMEEIVDDPVDCYWLIKSFVNQFHTKFGDSLPHLVSLQRHLVSPGSPGCVNCSCFACSKPKSLEHYLSQEEPQLLNHLKTAAALPQLPYNLWFRRCFAGCLPESSLQRSVCKSFIFRTTA